MTRVASRLRAAAGDLRAAGAAELFWRATRRLASASGRMRARFPPGYPDDDAVARALAGVPDATPERWRAHLLSRPASSFFFPPSARLEFQRLLDRFEPVTRAERVTGGAACLFGEMAAVPQPIDWHRDPFSGATWPAQHWTALDVASAAGGDARAVWEVSRHRDLFLLGRAYWRSGDEAFASAAAARVRSWLDANPAEIGINWWSNLEVALRAQAFVWALHFFAGSAAFDARLIWRMTAMILASARHVERDLPFSERCMPGNHVIGDAAGLALVALALPEFGESCRWRDRAIATLEREAVAQVLPDGTHAELSPAYHAFVWELLFGVWLLARRHGLAMPATASALPRMARALATVSTPGGGLPLLGDDDGGVAWDLGRPERRVRAIEHLSAAAFDDQSGAADGEAVEDALWLLGPDAIRVRSSQPRSGPAAPLVARTGFGVSGRSPQAAGGDYWIVRHGGLSKHTHADALSLLVTVGGEPCLIDAGTFGYNASSAWRRFFRSTAAHNTIRVDGLDQAEPHRTFRWASRLASSCRIVSDDDRGVLVNGEHDGYARIGVSHRRQVLWLRGFGWIVVDRLDGTGDHDVDVRWLMPATAVQTPYGAALTSGRVSVGLAVEPFGVRSIVRGAEDPPAGWTSPSYGRREPAACFSTRAMLSLPATIVSVIAPLDSTGDGIDVRRLAEGTPVRVAVAAGTRAVAVAVETDAWRPIEP